MIGSNFSRIPLDSVLAAAPGKVPVSDIGPLPGVKGNRPGWVPDGVYDTGIKGFGQRLGDALKEPGMSTAMLRGAAASFAGKGIGGALDAITGSMDQTHAREAGAAQQAHDNELADAMQRLREATQEQNDYVARGGLALDAGRLAETRRSNMANEGLGRERNANDRYQVDTSAATARRGQDVSMATSAADNATSRENNIRSTEASRYGSQLDFLKPAGIGSSAVPMQTTTTTIPARTVGGIMGFGGTKEPAKKISVRAPVAAAPGAPDEIRYDAAGNAYRRDPATGQPVPVNR